MKKFVLFMLAALILFCAGCAKIETTDTTFSTSVAGEDIIISFNEGTKSDGTIITENGTYSFSYSFEGTLSITYPNGYTYSQKKANGGILTSWPYAETAAELGYIDGFLLSASITEAIGSTKTGHAKKVPVLVSLLILLVGIWFVFMPQNAWWLTRGWRYQNVEPSELSLTIYRLLGFIIIVFGFFSFFA